MPAIEPSPFFFSLTTCFHSSRAPERRWRSTEISSSSAGSPSSLPFPSSSVSLLFGFNGYVFACLLIGGFARLFLTAVRLPNGERGHFQILFYAFPILAGICIRFEFAGGWILLVFFWAFLVYSESRLLRHHRDEQANSRKAGPTAS